MGKKNPYATIRCVRVFEFGPNGIEPANRFGHFAGADGGGVVAVGFHVVRDVFPFGNRRGNRSLQPVGGLCFGSAHASGLNMAMCDGSVQSISYSINGDIHLWLGARNDGRTIDAKSL